MIGLTLGAVAALCSEIVFLRETGGRAPFGAVRGDMVPTKSGFNLTPDALDDLILGFDTASTE